MEWVKVLATSVSWPRHMRAGGRSFPSPSIFPPTVYGQCTHHRRVGWGCRWSRNLEQNFTLIQPYNHCKTKAHRKRRSCNWSPKNENPIFL